MKACFLVLLAFGAALAAEQPSDAAPKEAKAGRQLAATAFGAAPAQFYNPARGYPGYQPSFPANNPANTYYQGATNQFSNYYPGSAYQGSAPAANYPAFYSGAPASFAASPYYSGAQFAPNRAFKPAYGQSAFAAPAYGQSDFAAPAYGQSAFAAPAFGQSAFAAPALKAAAPAPAFAAPAKAAYAPAAYGAQPNSIIVKQVLDSNFDGSFTSSYETDQGQVVDSRGFVKNAGTPDETQVIQGSYSYISPEGQPITTYYIADENGFQVQGDHLPQPPAIPEAIAKSLAYQASLPAQPEYAPYAAAPAASASAPAVVLAKKAL